MPKIAVHPPARFTLGFLYAVAAAFTCFLLYFHLSRSDGLDPDSLLNQVTVLLGMFVGMTVLAGLMLWAIRRTSLALNQTQLIFKTGFYGRVIPRASLRLGLAYEGSLYDNQKVAPRWRTNGLRLPGYQAGWFRLVNGEKALVLLTDPFHVTYLPTSEGYSLLVSTSELLRALNELPPAQG